MPIGNSPLSASKRRTIRCGRAAKGFAETTELQRQSALHWKLGQVVVAEWNVSNEPTKHAWTGIRVSINALVINNNKCSLLPPNQPLIPPNSPANTQPPIVSTPRLQTT